MFNNKQYSVLNKTLSCKLFKCPFLITLLLTSFCAALVLNNFPLQSVAAKKHSSDNHISIKIDRLQQPQQITHFIRICCAWGDKLANGILTYQISDSGSSSSGGFSEAARQAVYNAIAKWNSKLEGFRLVEATPNNSRTGVTVQPDIEINIALKSPKVLGSNAHFVSQGVNFQLAIGGLTQDSFDSSGFINHIKITLPTNALGISLDSSLLQQMAEHEIGHALGLGHANFNGDLMFPMANFQTNIISQCDVNAVLQANHWKIVGSNDSSAVPQMPQVDHVDCT